MIFTCGNLLKTEQKPKQGTAYTRDKYDVDRKCWDPSKKQICVKNDYIGKFSDFEVVIKKRKKSKNKFK